MAYSDISTLKSEVPKRSRIVSEQEQAKTDNRRAVRFDKNLCPNNCSVIGKGKRSKNTKITLNFGHNFLFYDFLLELTHLSDLFFESL